MKNDLFSQKFESIRYGFAVSKFTYILWNRRFRKLAKLQRVQFTFNSLILLFNETKTSFHFSTFRFLFTIQLRLNIQIFPSLNLKVNKHFFFKTIFNYWLRKFGKQKRNKSKRNHKVWNMRSSFEDGRFPTSFLLSPFFVRSSLINVIYYKINK